MSLANFLCKPLRTSRRVLITGHFCLILTRAGGACLSELAEAAESGGGASSTEGSPRPSGRVCLRSALFFRGRRSQKIHFRRIIQCGTLAANS